MAAAGVRDFEGIIFAPARLCTQDRSWPGYVVVADTMLGFFDSADLAVERIEDGSPVMLKLADIKRVRLSVPAGMALDVPLRFSLKAIMPAASLSHLKPLAMR